jgi:hypothetical protein
VESDQLLVRAWHTLRIERHELFPAQQVFVAAPAFVGNWLIGALYLFSLGQLDVSEKIVDATAFSVLASGKWIENNPKQNLGAPPENRNVKTKRKFDDMERYYASPQETNGKQCDTKRNTHKHGEGPFSHMFCI